MATGAVKIIRGDNNSFGSMFTLSPSIYINRTRVCVCDGNDNSSPR